MDEYREQLIAWAGILGPNVYLQALILVLASIAAGKIAEIVTSRVLLRLAKQSFTSFDDDIVIASKRPIFTTFVLVGFALSVRVLGLPETPAFVTLGLLRSIAIIVWYIFLSQTLAIVLQSVRASGRNKLVQMLPLLQTFARIILLALAIYFLFLAWKVDVTAWLASAGIIGLALSFAAKDSLANLFAGITIAADDPYKIGDFIVLETGERGRVTEIGMRSTRIQTRDDIEITIPNGVIGNSKIINEAGGPSARHRVRVSVGVAYGSDIDQVISVLESVAAEDDDVCKTPSPRVRFREFGDSSLNFQLLCWINQPVDRGRVVHELNCAVYRKFIQEGIVIPFPQRDLHVVSMPAADG